MGADVLCVRGLVHGSMLEGTVTQMKTLLADNNPSYVPRARSLALPLPAFSRSVRIATAIACTRPSWGADLWQKKVTRLLSCVCGACDAQNVCDIGAGGGVSGADRTRGHWRHHVVGLHLQLQLTYE
eukprot:COSAG05_NODE_2863_length_2558_cov_3.866612_5_plen_127_part_00